MGLVTYAAFMTWLLAFQKELPLILEDIQVGVEAFVSAYQRVSGTLPASQMDLTAEEVVLEGKVAGAVAGPNGAFDGERLRKLYQVAKDLGLLPIIMSMLTKK